MALTIPSLGLRNVPVMDSVTTSALNQGVVHLPDTSLPWSNTPERNVYLAGHRLGWPGTGSHLIFYRLDELTGGEDHAPRQGRHEIRLQGARKFHRTTRRELGNGPGEGTGPSDAADVHFDTDLPEEAHRSRRADLALKPLNLSGWVRLSTVTRLEITPLAQRIPCYHALVDRFGGSSRFEICLIKALLWHGAIGVIAVFAFWGVDKVTRWLGVGGMLLFPLGDTAIAITFAVLTAVSVTFRCSIVEISEIVFYGVRRR